MIDYKRIQLKMNKTLPVYEETESYNFRYEQFAQDTDDQIVNNHWTWKEIDVSKDKQDFLVEMSESEKFATIFFLKIFLKYEINLGSEFWADKFFKMFKRPEFRRKSIFNSHQELNAHAPFYNELNKVLGLTDDDFYSSYLKDPELVERVKFMGKMLNSEFDLFSLATYTFIEGAVLYSSFAFFKHFQMNGKNLLANVVGGIDMSVLDENNHSIDSSNAFKIVKSEAIQYKLLDESTLKDIESMIYGLSDIVFEHECLIIDKGFSKGHIPGITKHQEKQFVLLRLNECLEKLGYKPIYNVTDKTIFEWFRNTTELYIANDAFRKKGREYKTGFNKNKVRYLED